MVSVSIAYLLQDSTSVNFDFEDCNGTIQQILVDGACASVELSL